MANQCGWNIINEAHIELEWNGGVHPDDLTIRVANVQPRMFLPKSHFGHGIVTWSIPFLFRTSESTNLLVTGPFNEPRAGIASLSGIVETDWSNATFTMNWQVTTPHLKIHFGPGDSICTLIPIQRNYLERFDPEIRPLNSDPDLESGYLEWKASRQDFNKELIHTPAIKWQRHYFTGKNVDGTAAVDHQTQLKLKQFRKKI
jgi:hypothetical protein